MFFRYTVRDVYDRSQRVKDSKRGMLGMCYILGPDLSLPRDQSIGYKNIMVVREALSGKRLTSLQHDFDKPYPAERGEGGVGGGGAPARQGGRRRTAPGTPQKKISRERTALSCNFLNVETPRHIQS